MIDSQWHEQPKNDVHDKLVGTVKSLIEQGDGRQRDFARFLRLYGCADPSLIRLSYEDVPRVGGPRTAWNVIHQIVDTLVSRIGDERPRPKFQSTDGDFLTRNRAEKLTQFVDGQVEHLNLYSLGREIFRDACIFGTGFLKLTQEEGRIIPERVLPFFLHCDQVEALYGSPWQLFQTNSVARNSLLKRFKNKSEIILTAPTSDSKFFTQASLTERIDIYEAWLLPSKPGAKDGRHVICIEGATLLDEKWERPTFPFVALRYINDPANAFWGIGVSQLLIDNQLQINKMLQSMDRAFQLAVPMVFVKKDSEVPPIVARIGNVIKYGNTKPSIETANPISQQMVNHLLMVYDKCFELIGLSQMSATSRKEPGVTAAVAMREVADVETMRFREIGRKWNEFYTELAKHLVFLAKEIDEEMDGYEIPVKGEVQFERVGFKDVDLDEDQYVLGVWATNSLPTTPAGRLQKVEELIQAGFIDRDAALELLDMPDLNRFKNLELSGRNIVMKAVDSMVNTGEYVAPEQFMPHDFAIKYAQNAFLQGRLDGAPDEHLDQVLKFIDGCFAFIERAEEEQLAEQPAQPPMDPNMDPGMIPGGQ